MDWNAAIERNREALKRILASLVAMAGLAGGAPTLPRHLHRAVVRLLYPAEAAARRLIIVAARGIVVDPPRPRPVKPELITVEPLLRHFGIAVVMSPADLAGVAATRRAAAKRADCPRTISLPLLDPLALPRVGRRQADTRWQVSAGAPRFSVPGLSERRPVRQPPSPDDPVSAARLSLRLAALASALDDLPAQARRFARWRVARDARDVRDKERSAQARFAAASARNGKRRRDPYDRISALKPGRPPGWRRKPLHEVDDVLNVVHGLAIWALEPPDTS